MNNDDFEFSEFEEPEQSNEVDQYDEQENPALLNATDGEDFDNPADNLDEDAELIEASQIVAASSELLDIADEIESQLLQRSYEETGGIQTESSLEGAGNIQGVGFGLPEDVSSLSGEPGSLSLNVYVAEPTTVDQVKAVLVDSMSISSAGSDSVPINVIESGMFEAYSHRFKIRLAPGGVSVGHHRITAGTLGCLATGRQSPRNRRLLVLSNNHVLANSNNARFGDSIIQPGRADGGQTPRDRIAILERYVPIRFGAGRVNYVDAATGWAWPKRVRKEMLYLNKGKRRFFRISRQVAAARRSMIVGKSGRTTQLTIGRVTDINYRGWVNYGQGRSAFFRDQIVIRGLGSKPFSQGGDSGSVIWQWNNRRNVVGLLFAGGGGLTIANKMSRVVSALDINLVT